MCWGKLDPALVDECEKAELGRFENMCGGLHIWADKLQRDEPGKKVKIK